MGFVLLGVALVLCRWLDLGPTAGWPWWAILAPFGLAVLWWNWSDNSGRTRRLQDEKYQRLRDKRRERAVESMGRRTRR